MVYFLDVYIIFFFFIRSLQFIRYFMWKIINHFRFGLFGFGTHSLSLSLCVSVCIFFNFLALSLCLSILLSLSISVYVLLLQFHLVRSVALFSEYRVESKNFLIFPTRQWKQSNITFCWLELTFQLIHFCTACMQLIKHFHSFRKFHAHDTFTTTQSIKWKKKGNGSEKKELNTLHSNKHSAQRTSQIHFFPGAIFV